MPLDVIEKIYDYIREAGASPAYLSNYKNKFNMCCILFYILMAFVVIIWIAIFLIAYNREKKSYNNGICPCCGNKLKLFDTDSQGGRGYDCPKCDYTTWVSYNVDKQK